MARRRRRARDAGLCYECCKQKPNSGRTVCVLCRSAKVASKRRSRQAKRVASGNAKLVGAHERAGDIANEHHFYEAAAQHYEDALQVSDADESAWMRLSEKLAEVLWLGNEPGTASTVNDRLLAAYRSRPERSIEHAKTLLRVARQLWADSRTRDRIPVLNKTIRIAELSNDPKLLQEAHIRMASTFVLLAYVQEAKRHLRIVEQLYKIHSLDIELDYYRLKGALAAKLGREKEAFANYNRVIEIAPTDPSYAGASWLEYGFMALRFGRTKLAKAHLEHGLLAARRSNIAWLIPRSCLAYAEFLIWLGEYTSAYEYLVEALSSDAQTPILEEMIAYVGIPLALHMKDEATLKKCMRTHVIDRVFLSGEPARIGYVATAFAQLYVEQGQNIKAQNLLHRAVEAIHTAHDVWEFPLEIARNGAKEDLGKARRLLEERIALPSARVAVAYLSLFDAFVAHREGRHTTAYSQAREAAVRFEGFQLSKYAELARSLLPVAEQRLSVLRIHHAQPFSEHAKFTKREREVAILVLKGLTNRAIAAELSIAESTVESHMVSIMSRLGIRSRYQLVDIVAEVAHD